MNWELCTLCHEDYSLLIFLQALEKIGLQSRPYLSHRLKSPGYRDPKDGIVMDRKIQFASTIKTCLYPVRSFRYLLKHNCSCKVLTD